MNYLKHNQRFLIYKNPYDPNFIPEKYFVVRESSLFYWIESRSEAQRLMDAITLGWESLAVKSVKISKSTGRELHPNKESVTVPVIHANARYRNEDGSCLEKGEPYIERVKK